MLSTQFIINDPIHIDQLLRNESLVLTGSSGTATKKIYYLQGIYGSDEDAAEHLIKMLQKGIQITINKMKVIGMSEHIIV